MLSNQGPYHSRNCMMNVMRVGAFLLVCIVTSVSQAQITIDGTIGGPAQTLTGPNYTISDDLGQTVGTNLLHSFGEFNVWTGESAAFTGPDSIENVIGRVTGGNSSFIDGLLSCTIIDANLFLLNPSGVMFGPNAQLDVNGSFHVSTADYLTLSDGGVFYADPLQTSILTASPPEAFGFLDVNPEMIAIVGGFLQVPDGETLSVVGGDIQIVGGGLAASSGTVNVVSVASEGEVASEWYMPFMNVDSFDQLGEISIWGGGYVSTSGDPAGTVVIRGENLGMDASYIFSHALGSLNGGPIDIQLRGEMSLTTGSQIEADSWVGKAADILVQAENMIMSDGGEIITTADLSGDAGDILLNVGSLSLTDNAAIESRSSGTGQGGDISITASESISLDGGFIGAGTLSDGPGGDIYLNVEEGSLSLLNEATITSSTFDEGDAGDILLAVGTLSLTDGSRITSYASGFDGTFLFETPGQGGNITIFADDSVAISGRSTRGLGSGIYTTTLSSAPGGYVHIWTPDLSMDDAAIQTINHGSGGSGGYLIGVDRFTLTGGAQVVSNNLGPGPGAWVSINATESVSISGQSSDGNWSGLFSDAHSSGSGGYIFIETPTLNVEDSGQIQSVAAGDGSAGYISLGVESLTLTGGANVDSGSYGAGQGGFLMVTASDSVSIAGESIDGNPSGLFSNAEGSGSGGYISIETPTLNMDEGGLVQALTLGDGNAGDATLNVGDLTLTGGAQVETSSRAAGQGGSLTVTASDSVFISGQSSDGFPSGFFSNAEGSGSGGFVSVETPTLLMDNGGTIQAGTVGDGSGGYISLDVGSLTLTGVAIVNSSSHGPGHAGDISVTATDSISISGAFPSGIFSQAKGSGNAGSVSVSAPTFTITDGGAVSCSTFGEGRGGSVTVTATDLVSITGTDSGLYTRAEGSGDGGDITVEAQDVQLTDGALITAESTGTGDAGSVTITVGDTYLSRDSSLTTEATQADGGNIDMHVGYMIHLVDSEITATVGGGPETVGGNITIDPEYFVLNGSDIIANAFEGQGGNIRISAGTFLADPHSVVSASSALGIDGTVDIRSPIINISGFIGPLPKDFSGAAKLLREPCAARIRGEEYGSFVISGRDGLPVEPHGLLPSPIYFEKETEEDGESVL